MKKIILLFMMFLFGTNLISASTINVTPATIGASLTAAADGDILLLDAGTYTSGINFQTGKVITLQGVDKATVIITQSIGLGTSTAVTNCGLLFKDLTINIAASYFMDGTIGDLKIIEFNNVVIQNVNRCILRTANTTANTIDLIKFNNCTIKNCGSGGYSFLYPKHIVKSLEVTNTTLYNYTLGESFFYPQTAATSNVFNFSFQNNTVYKWGKDDTRALCNVRNLYSTASNYVFKNNIIAEPGATLLPKIVIATGGNLVAEKNLVVNYGTYTLTSATSSSITDNTLAGLGLSTVGFADAANGDFSIVSTSPVATASTTVGIIGDPRWLKVVSAPANLTVSAAPAAGGTVTPSSAIYNQGDNVTMTATRNFGYSFKRWVDGNGALVSTANPYTFTITSNTTYVAEFEPVATYTLNVNVLGAYGLGEFSIAPAGKDGAFSVYEAGTNVTITAIENDIVKFSNWSDSSTALSTSVVMDANKSITGTYDNQSFIAGWTFKNDQYAHPRVAELYSNVENRPQLFAYQVSDNTVAPNVRLLNRGGVNGLGVWNTNKGQFFHFMTSFSTVGYKNINVSSGLIGYYYGCDEWTFQYSLDGVNFVNVSSLTTINTSSITSIGGILPVEAEGKAKIYLRWFPNVTGPKHGSATDVTATVLSNVTVKADEVLVSDAIAPVLQTTLPAAASTTVGASGYIILTYDEKVKLGTGTVTFNGKVLTPEFVNKTVKFSYYGLEYDKPYTFNMPAGLVTDLSGNSATALNLSFKTMVKPIPAKRVYDLIVDANATTTQLATGKYVKTIAEAFTAAPLNSTTRFLVFITNGTYNLGGDGTNPQGIVLQLPAGKNNVSLIAQSKDNVILQGNPGWGIKNAVLSIEANDLYMENITIEHKDGMTTAGQRPALNPAGDRNVYNGIRLRSKQDTQVTGGNRSFYYKSTIEGDVDFICGGGTHWFEECKLVSVAAGYLVAPNHLATEPYGYVFNNNTITAVASYYLGRPWQNAPRAVYLNTTMVTEPNTQGWASMGTLPALFAEYNSVNGSGVAVNTDNRTNVFSVSGVNQTGAYNPVLTKAQADEYTIENVLGGTDKWDPRLVVEQVAAPTNLSDIGNNTLKWDDNQYAVCYVVCREGKVLGITTDATYTDTTAAGAKYAYTVQAVSEYGGLSTASATTTLGLGKIKDSNEVIAYPMPTTGVVNLSLPKGIGSLNYEVYSIQGQKVKNGLLPTDVTRSIDLSNLNSGVYIISMKNAEGAVYKAKVIKN
ncbi:pectinesterase family protein [Flavobacterium limnophilum]|uniref:pectinesterase family protein n=1 Tax=Flavobacterium limnophilum TaxID=3003262 RepID=UPI00248320B4|nr:pectinesterase family protein [Flavobacterium limnophilum]